jgi:outer membrane lipoprotein carrier protein
MKQITFLLLLFSFTFTQSARAQDQKARQILDAMSKKYQALKAFRVNFSQSLENAGTKMQENLDGEITVMGDKFRLRTDDQEIINNGNTIWTYIKSENEVNISENDPEEQGMTPNRIFTMYKKGYKYAYVDETQEAGELCDVIELSPEDRNDPVFKVRLNISKKDKALKSWKMFRNNGNRYTYTISNFTPNPNVDNNFFAFDKSKFKGVKVIDLR